MKMQITCLSTLALMIGIVTRVNAYIFDTNVGAIQSTEPLHLSDGGQLPESSVAGFHFTATPEFARTAAKTIMADIDNDAAATGGVSASVVAHYVAGEGDRHLNLAECQVNGQVFYIRKRGENVYVVHDGPCSTEEEEFHFGGGIRAMTAINGAHLEQNADYGFHFQASKSLVRGAASEFMPGIDYRARAVGANSKTYAVLYEFGPSIPAILAQVQVDQVIFWIKKVNSYKYYVYRQA